MEESKIGWEKEGTLYFPKDLLSHNLGLLIPFPWDLSEESGTTAAGVEAVKASFPNLH